MKILSLLLLLLLTTLSQAVWAQGLVGNALSPREAGVAAENNIQVVVLRNGNVLVGEVDLLGDAYRVATATSEVRLAVRDVERVVGSMIEAYEAKRAEVRVLTTDEHLRLAAWSIRQEMWPQAARELNDARNREPRHPAIPRIERRLQLASRAAMQTHRPVPSVAPVIDHEALKQQARELRELESLAASLPAGSLETFTRQVQPILLNSCTAAGCHGPSDQQSLKLNRDLLKDLGGRESTLRNLKAVWGFVDQQNPEASPLLTQPAVPHGGLQRTVFSGSRQKLLAHVSSWVREATRAEQREAAARLAAQQKAVAGLIQPARVQPARVQPAEFQSAGVHAPALERPLPAVPSKSAEPGQTDSGHFWEVAPDGTAAQSGVKHGLELKGFVPKDEFDPEAFNRQQKQPE